ncbi:MAG: hypothetical protein H7144_04630 [Burkholderiales bacterium]|nr:hypothetical protein [Phycisphaerae bacterium]
MKGRCVMLISSRENILTKKIAALNLSVGSPGNIFAVAREVGVDTFYRYVRNDPVNLVDPTGLSATGMSLSSGFGFGNNPFWTSTLQMYEAGGYVSESNSPYLSFDWGSNSREEYNTDAQLIRQTRIANSIAIVANNQGWGTWLFDRAGYEKVANANRAAIDARDATMIGRVGQNLNVSKLGTMNNDPLIMQRELRGAGIASGDSLVRTLASQNIYSVQEEQAFNSLQTLHFGMGALEGGLRMTPGGNTALAISDGEGVSLGSLGHDAFAVATIFGPGLALKGGKALWGLQAARGTEMTIAARSSLEAIAYEGATLSAKQSKILNLLTESGSRGIFPKNAVGLNDLAALTAKTGDEFAMFTTGGRRLIVRGSGDMIPINVAEAQVLASQGWRWSAHTHPTVMTGNALSASAGDMAVLQTFNQSQSIILNALGQTRRFTKAGF